MFYLAKSKNLYYWIIKRIRCKGCSKKNYIKKPILKSDEFFKKNKILSANPGATEEKLDANRRITAEILRKKIKNQCIVSSVNNGSHILGLSKNLKNPIFYGVYTKSKLAKSINSFALTEIKKRNKYKTLNLIKANDKEVIKGFHLLSKEGLFLDGSSSAIIGSLNQIKHKNICCVLSGAALNNLTEVQKIISKMKN